MKKSEILLAKEKAAEYFLNLPEYRKCSSVMFYVSIHNEVDTYNLIDQALEDGKKVLLPKCRAGNKVIEAIEIKNTTADLRRGLFGILEPVNNLVPNTLVSEIDVIVVPCVGVDRKGNRLGRGAGYYDRFLKNCVPGACKIGFAYDFQLFEYIPNNDYDIPVNIVITEKEIIRC